MAKWVNDTYHIVEGKHRMLPRYNQWFDMKQRCTSTRSKSVRPTYQSCAMHPNWESYDSYVSWAECQIGHLQVDFDGNLFQLDKDLIGSGDYYGPDTCVFIPQEVNKFLTGSRGNSSNGCHLMKHGKWRVTVRNPFIGKNVHLGMFKSVTDAEAAHAMAKHRYALELAEKWKVYIDPRAYKALLNRYVQTSQ
ncbi:HNH endonuclease [Pseudomonas phage vB_PpuM-NoPa]|uniref:HNH endonuclease n=2 Tax=Tartuvirus TaxID=3424912 RepID=A0AAX4MXD1_9CAUD